MWDSIYICIDDILKVFTVPCWEMFTVISGQCKVAKQAQWIGNIRWASKELSRASSRLQLVHCELRFTVRNGLLIPENIKNWYEIAVSNDTCWCNAVRKRSLTFYVLSLSVKTLHPLTLPVSRLKLIEDSASIHVKNSPSVHTVKIPSKFPFMDAQSDLKVEGVDCNGSSAPLTPSDYCLQLSTSKS